MQYFLAILFVLIFFTGKFILGNISFGHFSSLAYAIAVIPISIINKSKYSLKNIKIFYILSTLYLLILYESLYLYFDGNKQIYDILNVIISLPIVIYIGLALQKFINERTDFFIYIVFKITLFIFIFFGWLSILYPKSQYILGYGALNNPVFPFTEPAYYALSLVPVSIIVFLKSKNTFNVFIILILLFQAVLLPNLTLIIVSIFLLLIIYRKYIKSLILCFIVIALFLFVLVGNNLTSDNYFISRLPLVNSSNNISYLTYLQGWYEIPQAIIQSSGLGLGYRMMGTNERTEIGEQIAVLGFPDLGRADGSFLFSRIATEFGFIGIILIGLYFLWLFKLFANISKLTIINNYKIIFSYYISLSLFIELFIRGGDYLSPQVIIALSCACYLANHITSKRIL